jgi:hypothetical protein
MAYREKAYLDAAAVHQPLCRLLNTSLEGLQLRFQANGYSGAVYRLTASTPRGPRELLLDPATAQDKSLREQLEQQCLVTDRGLEPLSRFPFEDRLL